MKYGYCRVSTVKQGKDGFSLEDQRQKLIAAGAEKIFSDTWTGTTLNRPEFDKLMKEIKSGDELLVTKLDRLARTAAEGCLLIQKLQADGITVNILNMGRADDTPMGKLMVTMLLAFSEFERDLIVERTQTGKARARENGVRVDGRPQKFSDVKLAHALDLLHEGKSYSQVVTLTGISKSTLIRAERKWKTEHSDIVNSDSSHG